MQPFGNMIETRHSVEKCFAFGQNNTQFALSSEDGVITIFDANTLKPLIANKVADSHIQCLCFDSSEEHIVFICDFELFIWAFNDSNRAIRLGKIVRDYPYRIMSLPNKNKLIIGIMGLIEYLNLDDINENNQPIDGILYNCGSVVFANDGRYLIYQSNEQKLSIWDFDTNERVLESTEDLENSIITMAISRDEKQLVTGHMDNTIRIWDIETLSQVGQPFEGFDSSVNTVIFSDDGNEIISIHFDQTIRKWNIQKREIAKEIYPLLSIDVVGLNFTKANICETDKMVFKQNGVKV